MADLEARNKNLFDKIVELARKGNLRLSDIRRHPDVLKLNNNKPVMFETVKNAIEKKLGKTTLNKIKNIPDTGKFKSETRKFVEDNIDKIKKDYLKGVSTTDLSKKYLNQSKSNTTLETVLKENVTKAEKAKRPDIIGKNKFQQVKKDPKKLAAILRDIPKMANKEVLEKHKISGVTLNEIKNEYGLKFGKMIKKPKDPKVTERLKKVANVIENTDLPAGQIDGSKPVVVNLAKKLNLTVPKFLSEVSRLKQEPERFNLSAKLKKDLNRFPDPKFVREALKAKGYGKKTLDTVTAVEKAAKQAVSSGSNLEHALPQSLIKEFKLPKKYLLTAERTSGFLNQFKKQYDNQLLKLAKEHAAGNVSYDDYKREVARISKIVADKTGGYKIGYVDFIDGKATAVTPQESLLKGEGDLGKKTKGLKNFFKNAIHHNRLYENYIKDPNNPAFATLREEIERRPGQFIKEVDAEKTAKAIASFTKPEQFYNFYRKNPDNIFFKALTRTASLAGGKSKLLLAGGATLPFLATALAAEEKLEPEIKYNSEIGAVVNTKTDEKVPQSTILEWAADNPIPVAAVASTPLLSKTVRQGTGKLLKGLLSTLASPLAATGFAGATIKANLDEGKNIVDATVDPMVGVELLYPEAAKRIGAKGITGALGKALSLGRVGTMLTPAGLGITALGLGKMSYNALEAEKEKLAGMSDDEREAYLAQAEEQMMMAP